MLCIGESLMIITEVQLQKFIELYQQEFGIQLTPLDARKTAEDLVYFISFAEPFPKSYSHYTVLKPNSTI